MQIKNIKSAILVLFLLVLNSATYAYSPEEWYQVDLIIFKPTTSNMDEETWPDFEPSYPFEVLAITEPRIFNLSQLGGLDSIAELDAKGSMETATGRDKLLFEFEGNNQRNRRLLESLGIDKETTNARLIENHQEVASVSKEKDFRNSEAILGPLTEIIELPPQEQDSPIDSTSFSPGAHAFKRTTEKSSLKNILESLNWSSRFRVSSHESWVQPMDAKPTFILVQAGKRYDNRFEIEGTLSFSRSRYLHIQTDLWFTRFEQHDSVSDTRTMKIASEHRDDFLSQYSDLVTIENQRGHYFVAATHRMIQSRRMRSAELHYLDHPLFGVIVRVNRYEPELQTNEPP